MVVTDTNGEDVYVVMGLEQYETLVDFQSSEDGGEWEEGWWDDNTGLDKPNNGPDVPDDAVRPETSPSPEPESALGQPSDIWEAMQSAGEPGDTWDLSKMSEIEKSDLERQFLEYQRQKGQESVVGATEQQKHEKPAENMKTDEDFGEEQFYLEPVE